MKIKNILMLCLLFLLLFGCNSDPSDDEGEETITLTNSIQQLETDFSAVKYDGDDGFEAFIQAGGAESDAEVITFLKEYFLPNSDIVVKGSPFGCSTFTVSGTNNERYFGRNFDWNTCNGMIVKNNPTSGYSSISTVNMDFVQQGVGSKYSTLSDKSKIIASLYFPVDGMNEKGLGISVNMVKDDATIEQDTSKKDITTSTAIRLILNQAATVDEAVELLQNYDLHASFGYMIHFAIVDASGDCVAVEYIDNVMNVIDTPILTNFYLTPGDKYGIGTTQSHERFTILEDKLEEMPTMTYEQVRDTLSSVSKGNFGEFESTEWSVAYDLTNQIIRYYHRENYKKLYVINF